LLKVGWLWLGGVLAVTGVWQASTIQRAAGWLFVVGAPVALVGLLITSIRVMRDRVVVRDFLGSATFLKGEASASRRSYGSARIVEFADNQGNSKSISIDFMSKSARADLLTCVRDLLPAAGEGA